MLALSANLWGLIFGISGVVLLGIVIIIRVKQKRKRGG
jgi:hypothetical protein